MSSNKYQYMSCGASSAVMNADGQMTTSVDALANSIMGLFSKSARNARRSATRQETAHQHA